MQLIVQKRGYDVVSSVDTTSYPPVRRAHRFNRVAPTWRWRWMQRRTLHNNHNYVICADLKFLFLFLCKC